MVCLEWLCLRRADEVVLLVRVPVEVLQHVAASLLVDDVLVARSLEHRVA